MIKNYISALLLFCLMLFTGCGEDETKQDVKNGEPSRVPSLSKEKSITHSKELFKELRSQAMSVVNYEDEEGQKGFLDIKGQEIEKNLENVVLNLSYMQKSLLFLVDMAKQLEGTSGSMSKDLCLISYDTNNASECDIASQLFGGAVSGERIATVNKISKTQFTYSIKETQSSTTWTGSVTLPSNLLAKSFDVLNDVKNLKLVIKGDLPLDYEPNTKAGIEDKQSFEGNFEITSKKLENSTNEVSLSLNGKVLSNGTSLALTQSSAELKYQKNSDGKVILDYFKLNEIVVKGVIASIYTIDGSLVVNSYIQNKNWKNRGGIEEYYESAFSLLASCADGQTLSNIESLKLNYNNKIYEADYRSISTRLDEGINSSASVHFGNLDFDIDTLHIENYLEHDIRCTQNSQVVLTLQYTSSYSDSQLRNSGWIPNDITFLGTLKDKDSFLSGKLTMKLLDNALEGLDIDNIENPQTVALQINFEGKLQMPEKPEMLLTLEIKNSNKSTTLNASYTSGDIALTLSSSMNIETQSVTLKVTTSKGLVADIKVVEGELDTQNSSLTQKGKTIGTFEYRSDVPVIKYTDGSFESLP